MSDPLLAEAPPPSNDFDALSIPPLDPPYLNSQIPHPCASSDDLDFVLDDNCDFDFTIDDLYFASEDDTFFLPSEDPHDGQFGDFSPDVDGGAAAVSPGSGSSGILGNPASLDVESYLNYSSSPQNSGNRISHLNYIGVSGGRSENSGSGVSSDNTDDPSPDSGNLVVDQKIKMEEVSKKGIFKRKKDIEETNNESRSNKYRKSSSLSVNEADNDHNLGEEEMKRKARLMRNRESAQLSRQRKKHYVEELEDKVRNMHSTIADLNSKISFFMAENASLKQQLSGSNAMPPPLGMYPPPPHMAAAPMPYGWMPCAAPYMVKPQGSQVPLVPIPRLKPQAAAAVPPRTKKSDGSKTKKVASVSFLGLLFFILLFGGLVPLVDVKYGGIRDGVSGGYFSSGFYNQHRGRVLTINGYSNGSGESMGIGFPNGRVGFDNRIHCARAVESKEKESQPAPDSDEFVRPRNASEPLVASLYVPRNDKLVKIDGNLIIHSVLAGEKAMASHDASKANSKEATGLAIPKDFSPALAIPDVRGNGARHSHFYRNPAERQRAISSGSTDALKDHMKSSAANGKLQQWFQEGLSGPLLSSGMCTEVFQFDASPAPGAIIPASSVANMTAEHRQNATQVNRGRNRRILHRLPVPLTNITGERKVQKESFAGNKSASSMVVSVLVDPRETGDGDVEGMISPKSLSRIFVVVLLDSVKYVTYSCGLPRSGLHLVTS
ncbi:bZIP transcription factor 17 [Citrus sinensis]|uniref:bZIP transcription factor 17-like n=1 Tax=Citrus sinensis TaxID=2711 RepID=UPI0003D773FD|nr:bZIP transcription factor 17-like [Citrus sinensis]KAH9675239.1 bZIP transcription factor 17 [Citrus sinensis]